MSTKLIDLGWCIGKITVPEHKTVASQLQIISPSDAGECYQPPLDVNIYGESIHALRDALNETFPVENQKPCNDESLIKALKEICLCSVNSASSSREMGDIARRALAAIEERK